MGAITGLTRLGTRGIRGARGVGCDGEDIVAGEKSDGGQDDWTGKWESRMTTAGQENGNNRMKQENGTTGQQRLDKTTE